MHKASRHRRGCAGKTECFRLAGRIEPVRKAQKSRPGRIVRGSEATGAYGIEKAQGAEGIDVACILRHVEGDLYVRLRTEIVDFGWLDLRHDVYEIRTVR